MTAQIADVASYILQQRGPMTAMKLQKLCYYSQAWHLVWEEKPLFESRIEAWANGPVIPELYAMHRRQFTLERDAIPGDPDVLGAAEKESIDEVLRFYGDMSGHELSELTHREDPWVNAREGLGPMERGTQEILISDIYEYYDGITTAADS